jgi:glycine dehydrogenase subunit 2
MLGIAALASSDPESLKRAPETTPVGRLDEAGAARRPDLRHVFSEASAEPD